MANNQLDESTNRRYQDMANGKQPGPTEIDILWITPKRLGTLFAVCLLMSVLFNGVV